MKVHKTEMIKIEDLKFAEYNPRKISDEEMEKLKSSLREFGFVSPAVINKSGVIIGGHQRIRAGIELGIKEIQCTVLDISKKKEKILNLALNKISGEWDDEKLKDIFKELQDDIEGAEDVLLTGFDSPEIDLLFQEDEPDISDEKDDTPAILPEIPTTKKGDIFQLGDHFLICGDSTEKETYETVLKKAGIKKAGIKKAGIKKADMTFTDPPYNVGYESANGKTIQNDKMSKIAFGKFLGKVCGRIVENTENGIYIAMSSSEIDQLKREFEKAGGHWSNFIIWAKNNFSLGRGDYHHQFEPILYGWSKKKKNHYFCGRRNMGNVWQQKGLNIEDEGDNGYKVTLDDSKHSRVISFRVKSLSDIEIDDKEISDIWNVDKPARNAQHPTMKPVELVSKAIKNSSKHGDFVLDPFGGSGSTMISCQKTGRRNISIELDEKYCDSIIERWEQFTDQKAKLIN